MSLINTLVQPLRDKYEGNLDKYEQRASRYGALNLFEKETAKTGSILSPTQIATIRGSFGNTVEEPVIDSEDVTIGTAISCNVIDSENISQLVQITFVPYSFGFTMTPAQHAQNEIGEVADFSRKMKKYLTKLAATMDTQAIATLEANKNQFFPAEVLDYYPQVGNAFQVSQSEKNDMYNNIRSIMEQEDFYDSTEVLANPIQNVDVRRFKNQGEGNSANESFQFAGYSFSTSNRVINNALIQSTLYAVNEGSIAIANRNIPEATMNLGTLGDGTKYELVTDLPFIGNISMAGITKSGCADQSALNGGAGGASAASAVFQYQFHTEMVYQAAYNSNPSGSFSPINKFEVTEA